MADEQAPPAGTPAAPAPGQVQDAGGGTLRVTPNTQAENEGPSLEEQEEAQRAAAAGGEAKPKEGEAGEAKPKEGEEAPAAVEPVDLKGTVFDGMSPEMQGKIAPFAAAFSTNGTLTDAEVSEAAHATGFSEAAVRQFMAGAQASAATSAAPIMETFGGETNYREFQKWTGETGNLSDAETRTINRALGIGPDGKPIEGASPDHEMAAQLMAGPMERWKAAGGGAAPRDVTQGSAGGTATTATNAGDQFANWSQVEKAMNDPRYRSDPSYRQGVEGKIARSKSLG